MTSNYKRLGDYIEVVNERNTSLSIKTLLGVSIKKVLMPSIANTIGTNMKTYKIIKKNQFGYGPVTSRNGDKISIALLEEYDEAIISQAYTVFEVIDKDKLLPEYLMMWFRRPEFDRYARFKSHGSARETFDWDELSEVKLPIPSIEKQQEIVSEYNTVINRIKLNKTLNQKLEETAQALYKHWFVDFEFPYVISSGVEMPYKSSGGKMVYNEVLDKEIPVGWDFAPISKYVEINSGYAFKSKWWTDKGLPVIKIGAIKNNSVSEQELEYISEKNEFKKESYRVKKGDIVLAMTGFTMGKIGLIPEFMPEFYVNQRVGFYRLDNSKNNNSGFLYCTLKTKEFQNEIWSFGGDSQQFNVSNNQVSSIKIAQPLNYDLIQCFNLKTSSFFEKIIYSQTLDRFLVKLKDLLLSKMTKVEIENEIVS